jgi:hypothetical protein
MVSLSLSLFQFISYVCCRKEAQSDEYLSLAGDCGSAKAIPKACSEFSKDKAKSRSV